MVGVEREYVQQKTMLKQTTECNICKDLEWTYYKGEFGEDIAVECSCVAIKKAKRHLANCGIEEAFRSKKIKDFTIEGKGEDVIRAKKTAIAYLDNFDTIRNTMQNSIALLGQVGSGKTHLCMSIANKLLGDGIGVVYMSYRDAIALIKKAQWGDEENKELKKYKNAQVLYIDDLFKGKNTETDINLIFELVNHRYLTKKPLLISSELYIDQMLEIDEAIGSRIKEMCRNFIVEIKGKNYNHRL